MKRCRDEKRARERECMYGERVKEKEEEGKMER